MVYKTVCIENFTIATCNNNKNFNKPTIKQTNTKNIRKKYFYRFGEKVVRKLTGVREGGRGPVGCQAEQQQHEKRSRHPYTKANGKTHFTVV